MSFSETFSFTKDRIFPKVWRKYTLPAGLAHTMNSCVADVIPKASYTNFILILSWKIESDATAVTMSKFLEFRSVFQKFLVLRKWRT